jgi:uncharacterized delta-60 repeat protein
MLQLDLLFARGWRTSWLGACLCWLLLGSAGLAYGQAVAPFVVRATPAGPVGLQAGQRQLLTATAVYPAFNSDGFNGPVYATAVQPDGKILVGGRFRTYNNIRRQYLARLNADGTLDTSFTTGTDLDTVVSAISVQSNGDILIGGDFTKFNGTACGHLARLSATGALDQTFVTSNGFDGPVRAIGEQLTNGVRSVVVGGEFTAYGVAGLNPNSNYLVRLTDVGGFDASFAAATHGVGTNSLQVNDAVLALVVQGSGGLLVGGQFSSSRRGIARLNSDGTLDTSFASSPSSGPVGGGIAAIAEVGRSIAVGGSFASYTSNGISYPTHSRLALLGTTGEIEASFTPHFSTATSARVTCIVALATTGLLVGGQFAEYAGLSSPNLVGLKPTGDPDNAFSVAAGFGAAVNSLALQANGNVVVGGEFTTYRAAAARYIARLKPSGKADDIDVPLPGTITYSWYHDGALVPSTGPSNTLLEGSPGRYWATATLAGGGTSTSNTATLAVAPPTLTPITVHVGTPTATPPNPLLVASSQLLTAKAEYPALQVGTGFSDRVNPVSPVAYIWEFKTQPNGKLVVGGNFTKYKGAPCRFIARLDADGSLDPTFAHATTAGAGINNTVTTVALQPDGKIVLSGDFTQYGNKSIFHFARLNTDGSFDPSFVSNGTKGLSNSASAIVAQPDGQLLVAGNFPFYNNSSSSQTRVDYVARLNAANGDLDTSFVPRGPANPTTGTVGLDSYLYALALQPDGKVLVAGHFSYYGPMRRERIARLNADGSLDPSFDPAGAGLAISSTSMPSDVYTLALQPDGKVLVGGTFADRLIRLNADGSRDLTFTPPSLPVASTGATTSVSALVLQSDGQVLVGGEFAGHVLRLDVNGTPTTATFSLTGTGFDDNVHTLAIQPDGHVLVGGPFTSYNGTANNRRGLARLNADGSLNDLNTPLPGTATYAWNNGSTGPTLTVATSGTYTATATFLGQTAISDSVNAVVNGAPPAPFSVRITPTGPLSLCPGSTQTLTAQVAGTTAPVTYEWWKVQNGGAPVSQGMGVLDTSVTPATTSFVASPGGDYFAIATQAAGTTTYKAASATVSLAQASPPALDLAIGLPGTTVVLAGANLEQITSLFFTKAIGTVAATFALNPATPSARATLTATVPLDAIPGTISALTACSSTPVAISSLSFPAPTLNPTPLLVGAQGSTVVVRGTNFVAGATTATLQDTSPSPVTLNVNVAVVSSTQLLITVPASATIGPNTLVVSTAAGSPSAAFAVTPPNSALTTAIYDQGTTPLPPGRSYDNLIIKSPAVVIISGSATSNIGITVNHLEVQNGATLRIVGDARVTGPTGSSLLLAAGATLSVGHPNGLGSGLAAPGAIQLDSMLFSPDASYEYSGSQPQATGTKLPGQVRNFTSTNSSSLTLSQPLRVAQVLTMAGTGHFYLDTKPLTLLSSAAGTALVVNNPGAGRVLGTATVQRYINPAANTGTGFRYYGAPVKGATAAMLAAPAFDYDQSRYRLPTPQDTLPLMSYGFTTSSLVPNTPLAVGRGYRASVPAATTVNFTGTLTTGDTTITLLRTGKAAYNGWNLVSNPYPAPLNWSKLVADGKATGIEAAVYVYESASSSVGDYRSYVNKVSNDGLLNQTTTGDLLIAMGQAFFVRVRQNVDSGTLTFRNEYRETSYTQQASFSRTALAAPFSVSLALERNGGVKSCSKCGHLNRIAIYADPDGVSNATQPFNSALDADARNLFSFSQQTLSIRAGTADTTAAIRAIAPPSATTEIPLLLSAASPDAYKLAIAVDQLSQLSPGIAPYLYDSSNPNNPQRLNAGSTTVNFTLSASEVLRTTIDRFKIIFLPVALATTPTSTALGSAVVFPNPAQHRIHVQVPAVPGATQVQATLFNALGQVVLRQNAPLPLVGTALDLEAEKLAGGVYILRLQAGSSTATRRVVLKN